VFAASSRDEKKRGEENQIQKSQAQISHQGLLQSINLRARLGERERRRRRSALYQVR
jgi:hypothetical protein